jgi:hypothetical protein
LIFRQQYRHSALPAEPAGKGTAPVSLLNSGVKQTRCARCAGISSRRATPDNDFHTSGKAGLDMKISEIRDLLEADVLCCGELADKEVYSACGSDMMSDVLAYVKDQAVLLTGLVNSQVIRTAEMMDMICIVFVRSKAPTEEMLALARESGIVILATGMRMYEACGKLYANGLRGNGGKA